MTDYHEKLIEAVRDARNLIQNYGSVIDAEFALAPDTDRQVLLGRLDGWISSLEVRTMVLRSPNNAAHSLERIAELSENLARRLCKRSWNDAQKAQHAADLAERDALLIAVRPSYADCVAMRDEEPQA